MAYGSFAELGQESQSDTASSGGCIVSGCGGVGGYKTSNGRAGVSRVREWRMDEGGRGRRKKERVMRRRRRRE